MKLLGKNGAGKWTRTTDLLITNKLLRRPDVGGPQKQAHIRGFADADRLYQGGYILVGVSACLMRVQA
jgi:hypothetical protein